jgi:hypothetical protein
MAGFAFSRIWRFVELDRSQARNSARRGSKPGLHGGQPAEKPPGQAGVVGENDALNL